jgi:hypothetical protein
VFNEGIPLSDLVVAAKGFEPSNKGVYLALANRIEKQEDKQKWIKALYPSAPSVTPVIWNCKSAKSILFVPRGTQFPSTLIRLTSDEKQALKERAQVAADYPFSWRGCEKLEFYGKQLKNPRIFMPREPAKGERVRAAIDLSGTGIGTSGHSIWLKRPEVPASLFKCLIAWINSKYFMQQIEVAEINLRAHGFSFEPNEVRKLRIPEWVLTEEVLTWVETVLANGIVTSSDFQTLDDFCTKAELTPLSAQVGEMMEARRKIEELLKKTASAKKSLKKGDVRNTKTLHKSRKTRG